jgi:hypothetical protein
MSWGPDARPAAVAVAFAGLATPAPDHAVTPALPLLLRVLSDRGLYATFFVEPELAAAEPFALEMVGLSANEVALLAAPGRSVADDLATLRRAGAQAVGALADDDSGELSPDLAYLALPGIDPATGPARGADGVVRIPVGRDDAANPGSFHFAFQAAVGRTLPQRGLLAIAPPAHRFERQDALDVLVESLDLLAGLQRAERLWLPTFAQLAEATGTPA